MKTLPCCGAVLLSLPFSCYAQVFTPVGVTPSGGSRACAISSDGSTVVGIDTGHAFRWTTALGMQHLSQAPSGFDLYQATDVSSDGSFITGIMISGSNAQQGFRWSASTGAILLNQLNGSGNQPRISADGNTIVGLARIPGASSSAGRWTASTGTVVLGDITGLPFGNGFSTNASAVSGNGSIVIGWGNAPRSISPSDPIGTTTSFVWSQSTGAVGITNNGQLVQSLFASDITADGSVVVGRRGAFLFRWSALTGYAQLSNNTNVGGSDYPRVTDDGQTIINTTEIWTATQGLRPLTTVLTEAGCNFAGWTDLYVVDISGNGRALCGWGTNPQGQSEAWYATIPAPTTAALTLLALTTTRRRRNG